MSTIIKKAIQFEDNDYLLYGNENSIKVYVKRPFQKRETLNIDGMDIERLKLLGTLGICNVKEYENIKTFGLYDINIEQISPNINEFYYIDSSITTNVFSFGLFPYSIVKKYNIAHNTKYYCIYLVKNELDGNLFVKYNDRLFEYIIPNKQSLIINDNNKRDAILRRYTQKYIYIYLSWSPDKQNTINDLNICIYKYLFELLIENIDLSTDSTEYITRQIIAKNMLCNTNLDNNEDCEYIDKKVHFVAENHSDNYYNDADGDPDSDTIDEYTDDSTEDTDNTTDEDTDDDESNVLIFETLENILINMKKIDNRLMKIDNYSSEIYNGSHPDSCCSWICHVTMICFIFMSIFIYVYCADKMDAITFTDF